MRGRVKWKEGERIKSFGEKGRERGGNGEETIREEENGENTER